MSRIGKAPITLPAKVTLEVLKGNVVKVKGPKGELFQAMDPDITIQIEGSTLNVVRPTEQKRHKALHGTYRALIGNMVTGDGVGRGWLSCNSYRTGIGVSIRLFSPNRCAFAKRNQR